MVSKAESEANLCTTTVYNYFLVIQCALSFELETLLYTTP